MQKTKTKTLKKRSVYSMFFVGGLLITLLCLFAALFVQELVMLLILGAGVASVAVGMIGYTYVYLKENRNYRQEHGLNRYEWYEIFIDFAARM